MKKYLEKVDEYIEDLFDLPVTAGTIEQIRDVLRERCEISQFAAKMERGAVGESRLSKEAAEEWVGGMRNEDGTSGAHWTMQQTDSVKAAQGIRLDPVDFWAAMNMMYSDYCAVAKKFNVASPEFFAALAEAFLCDADAPHDKLARYAHAMED